jgi:hypothetical protein
VAKPVSRAEYVFGRYAGLVVTTTLNLAVMAAFFAAVLAIHLGSLAFLVETPFFATVAAIALQLAMVGAIAVLFSSFTTGTLAAIFTLSLVVAGHLASELVRYWVRQGEAAAWVGRVLYLAVPNLEALNLKEAMVYRDAVAGGAVATAAIYGVLYSAGVVALAAGIFSRRDLR